MKDTQARDVQEFFERVAGDWDTMRLSYYDGRVIERMAEVSGADGAMTVADVGTGTGFVATGIAPRVARVVAVDNSPAMLAGAGKNLGELGVGNAELVEGDVRPLPLEDASVDAAFANMVLHHAEDPPAMLAEMAGAVRPGGTVAIVDEVEHPYGWMREEHAGVWLGFAREHIDGFFRGAGLGNPATRLWACSDASVPRPRARSQT